MPVSLPVLELLMAFNQYQNLVYDHTLLHNGYSSKMLQYKKF